MYFERQQQRDLKKTSENAELMIQAAKEGRQMTGYIDLNEKFLLKEQMQNLGQII